MMPLHQQIMLDNLGCVREDKCPLHLPRISGGEIECVNGSAMGYPCRDVNLLSFVPLFELGSQVNASGNDIWRWTQYDDDGAATGYFALTCQTDGVSIVDISAPTEPNVLAFVESNTEPIRHINWRDLKIFGDYAFVVADTTSNFDDHGLQIFNIPDVVAQARAHETEVGFEEIWNVASPAQHLDHNGQHHLNRCDVHEKERMNLSSSLRFHHVHQHPTAQWIWPLSKIQCAVDMAQINSAHGKSQSFGMMRATK